ncbi:MAG: hypothetical protein HN665_03230 [Candidatus Marinimicrobia bacterium]|nr:hypothetical protein [Candidatus Neomarinimicrobiota bacterium]MBT3763833.1 hypothetical protein [Candidatus Neomarinimicrobiota bacterium]MBT4270181.1 hypothetical protein [Candidatus Neomarinimicrobiota bacterium]MBT4808830.1 hypothetical protein [Candidatus Neomarinimicrobiota bacterium]MBT6390917.1 hypothetical protein [Candidatus Neomarinimicrobiota bacterium]
MNFLQLIILLFGIAICTVCVLSLFSPFTLIRTVRSIGEKNWMVPSAVISRLILGTALILSATDSKFPSFFMIIGWISILSAIIILFMGRERINNLMDWLEERPALLLRLWMVFGAAFGAWIIYGIL